MNARFAATANPRRQTGVSHQKVMSISAQALQPMAVDTFMYWPVAPVMHTSNVLTDAQFER